MFCNSNSWKYCDNYYEYTPNIADIGCGTPPTPSLTDVNHSNFMYSSPQQQTHSNVDFVPKIENEYCINYMPTSMTSPTNTSFSSSPPTPDMLWEFGSEVDAHVNHSYTTQHQQPQQPQHHPQQQQLQPTPTHHNYIPDIESNNCAKNVMNNCDTNRIETKPILDTADITHLPNLKATKHQLIKEGLKVTIQSKRMALGLNRLSSEDLTKSPPIEQAVSVLSREDEERRRRRRERNKVAATKCRNKKKYHVSKLSEESSTLEEANGSLQKEILNLKREQQKLLDVLNNHLPICRHRKHFVPYLAVSV